MRMYRLNFSMDNFRSIHKTFALASSIQNKANAFEQIVSTLDENPALLHTMPSYLEIEVISDCDYKCSFCPRQYIDVHSNTLDAHALKGIVEFAEQGYMDTSVALGGLGEPLQHPNIETIIGSFLDADSIPYVILETNGYYLDKIISIAKHKNVRRFFIIVNINGIENYGKIHGVENENFIPL